MLHVLKTTLFMLGHVWTVYQLRCVLSITVMRFIVLMNMTFPIVRVTIQQDAQPILAFQGIVGMVLLKGMKNVRKEGMDVKDVFAQKGGIPIIQLTVKLNVGMGT